MPVPIHQATIQKGKVILKNANRFHLWVGQFEGKEVQIIVQKKINHRSLAQNSLYWLYLEIISADSGNTTEDLHEYLKRALLPPRYKIILDHEVKLPATTTELDTLQFTEYMSKIEQLTEIPVPNYDEIYLGK